MNLREKITNRVHGALCNGEASSDHGCCGCASPVSDVYIAACDYCGKGFEHYCWSCINTWPDVPAYTVLPGHERSGG